MEDDVRTRFFVLRGVLFVLVAAGTGEVRTHTGLQAREGRGEKA